MPDKVSTLPTSVELVLIARQKRLICFRRIAINNSAFWCMLSAIAVEALNFPIELCGSLADVCHLRVGQELLIDDLVEGAVHVASQSYDSLLVIIECLFVIFGLGAGRGVEEVVGQLAVRFPEPTQGLCDLHTIETFGLFGFAPRRYGAEVGVADEGDTKVQTQDLHVRDIGLLQHVVKHHDRVLDGVLVNVVADASLHGEAEIFGPEELVRHGADLEHGGGVGAGLGGPEHVEEAVPVVLIGVEAVVADHEVPVLDTVGAGG